MTWGIGTGTGLGGVDRGGEGEEIVVNVVG